MNAYNIKKMQNTTLFFINKSKLFMIGIVILSFVIFISYYYWKNYYNNSMMKASTSWQQISTINNLSNQLQIDTAQHFASINNNNYGAFISLSLAKQFVRKNDFISTERHLKNALKQTNDANLKSLIKLRLARVQLQQKNIDGALKTLNWIKGRDWVILAEDIRGDAQILNGNYKAARISYEKALKSKSLQMLVRTKLNNFSE